MVKSLQALFNQDNGTGRIQTIGTAGPRRCGAAARGMGGAASHGALHRPQAADPRRAGRGGTDNASFVCYGAPAFGLGSLPWEYFTYTWHTNRDTYDKIVFDELRTNATLTAMLAYLAADDPVTVPRDRRVLAPDQTTKQPPSWPECSPAARTSRRAAASPERSRWHSPHWSSAASARRARWWGKGPRRARCSGASIWPC